MSQADDRMEIVNEVYREGRGLKIWNCEICPCSVQGVRIAVSVIYLRPQPGSTTLTRLSSTFGPQPQLFVRQILNARGSVGPGSVKN